MCKWLNGSLVTVALLGSSLAASAQPVPLNHTPDATLRSTPETVIWGYFAADIPPVLRIKSGQTVKIDTVSHGGVNTGVDPVTFFGRAGIAPDQVLKDAVDIYQKVDAAKGRERAYPDRTDLHRGSRARRHARESAFSPSSPASPTASTAQIAGTGVLPDLLTGPTPKVIKFDLARNVALFSNDIEVPLQPFMGIMAVAPSRESWMISSRPPSHWGGNMDFNKLTAGATLFLPVFHDGAQFFTGDSHAAQGDGEVNGTAIEASLTGTLQFIVHKGAGKSMSWPRAEDAAHYYAMGIDVDLNVAMREATRQTVDFLRERFRPFRGRRLCACQRRR